MTLMERIERAKKAWSVVLPDIVCAPDKTLAAWLTNFKGEAGDKAFEDALSHCPQRIEKWRKQNVLVSERTYRLITTCMVQAFKNNPNPRQATPSFAEIYEQCDLRDAQVVAKIYCMLPLSELVLNGVSLAQLSDAQVKNIRLVQEQSLLANPNLALCSNLLSSILTEIEAKSEKHGSLYRLR